MNVWLDWVMPILVLLALVAAMANMVVATRVRRRCDAALVGMRQAADRVSRTAAATEAAAARVELGARETSGELIGMPVTVVHVPGPVRHLAPALPRELPPECAVNEHDWSRPEVVNLRVHPAPGGQRLLCSVTWHCSECTATRHEQRVPPPVPLAVAGPGVVDSFVDARAALVAGPGCAPALPSEAVS